MNTKHPERPTECGCLLPALAGPTLRGPLVGLKSVNGELHVEKSVFACCHGDGVRSVGLWELSPCSLKQRLLEVNRLWHRFTGAVGLAVAENLVRGMPPEFDLKLMRHLGRFSRGETKKGVILSPSEVDRPSLIWYVALAATWRFGIRCHLIEWHVGSQAQWAPAEKFWDAEKRMILVADVDQLWDPIRIFDLEWLMGLAYQSDTCFWMGYSQVKTDPLTDSPQAKSGAPVESARKRQFGAMLKKAKDRAPEEWLSKDMRSKLGELCLADDILKKDIATKGRRAPSSNERLADK